MAILLMLALPIPLIFAWLYFLAKGRRAGLGISFLFFVLAGVFGYGSISISKSSTAAIGLLFLPFYGSLAGFFAWGYIKLKKSEDPKKKIAAWVSLVAALLVLVYLGYGVIKTLEFNQQSLLQEQQ